ncbi:MAG: hypothetical protein QM682_15975 [Paracoccus sp. (in: a-proteobacteria)]|uniref:hypothetical protein n=1 Tax=Paracoccus sp. TaxID=267 RepID=UPI0039E5D802
MGAPEKLQQMLLGQGRDRLKLIGVLVSVAWLGLVLLAAWMAPEAEAEGAQAMAWLIWLLEALLPLGLIWLAVGTARSLFVLRDEAEALRGQLKLMREPGEPQARASLGAAVAPPMPAPGARSPLPKPASTPASASVADQVVESAAPALRLTPAELYFALNFPEGPDDHEAIRCLRLALGDPELAKLIRAAQDVITLLAAQGLYMDDLTVPETDAALWGRYTQGARGEELQGLAVIRSPAALAQTGAMLGQDEVFRDVAHHFMRHFDRLLVQRAQSDAPAVLAVLSETRSGRAFILLGQATGTLGGHAAASASGSQADEIPAEEPEGNGDGAEGGTEGGAEWPRQDG